MAEIKYVGEEAAAEIAAKAKELAKSDILRRQTTSGKISLYDGETAVDAVSLGRALYDGDDANTDGSVLVSTTTDTGNGDGSYYLDTIELAKRTADSSDENPFTVANDYPELIRTLSMVDADGNKTEQDTARALWANDLFDVSGTLNDWGYPPMWEGVLPTASADTAGIVKVGDGLTMTDGVLSAGSTGGLSINDSDQLVDADGNRVGGFAVGTGSAQDATSWAFGSEGCKAGNESSTRYAFAVNSAKATGLYSFACGSSNTASGMNAHVEGNGNTASGSKSHAEGYSNDATGEGSHSQGRDTLASGKYSHAEGNACTASGDSSHAQGYGTIAASSYQFTAGKYNVEDSASQYAEIVGNGSSDSARSNARTLDWDGNETLAGSLSSSGFTVSIKDDTGAEVAVFKASYDAEKGPNLTWIDSEGRQFVFTSSLIEAVYYTAGGENV